MSIKDTVEKMFESGDLREDNIFDLPEGNFTLTFDTNKLLELFDLPKVDDLEAITIDYWPSDSDLLNTSKLDVSQDDDGNFIDADENPLPEEVIDDIKRAIMDAVYSGTMGRYHKRIISTLEESLSTFQDYKYEYFPLTDDGERTATGVAKGILNFEVSFDETKIECAPDIVHIINDCINGVGEFYATDDLEGDSVEEFAKSRFHWLNRYWDIYGGGKPQVDTDNIDDFDSEYFRTLLKEIETEHNVKLT